MSVQFGRWSFGEPFAFDSLAAVEAALAPFGPDGISRFSTANMQLLYASFRTTRESGNEKQPYRLECGRLMLWDGRLDNRDDLLRKLRLEIPTHAPDGALVAAAYEQCQTDVFQLLLGDWALALSDPIDRRLILARDFLGSRPLHYVLEPEKITWCTVLDLLAGGKSLQLDEEYLAGWLSHLPAAHRTPFVGISSVPPGAWLEIKAGKPEIRQYWNFSPGKRIRYRSDHTYEEHFRSLFENAVKRCLRSDRPVLAELSGGFDSSSIVCVADRLMREGCADTPRLDTVSYFSDSDPDWNERPYFEAVERMRGCTGLHLGADFEGSLPCEYESPFPVFTPSAPARQTQARKQFAEALGTRGIRVVLSGIGGDEMLGGVPAPVPALADHLSRLRFGRFFHDLAQWSLARKTTMIQLAKETCQAFFSKASEAIPADWLNSDFVERHRAALAGYPARLQWFGPLPSFQANLRTLEALRRQISCCPPSQNPPYEVRYPLLDRELLEFLLAIPRDQVLRSHERRSLMRRALRGIVPDEILNRKRKAFVSRGNMTAIAREWPRLAKATETMVSASIGVVDPIRFDRALRQARDGQSTKLVYLIRTLAMEFWLRQFLAGGREHEECSAAGSRLGDVKDYAKFSAG